MAIIDNQAPIEEMGLEEMLLEIGSQQSALLDYANGVTGAEDTRLGDAVRTLADGYGGGCGVERWSQKFTASSSTNNCTIPAGVITKIARTSALVMFHTDYAAPDASETRYPVIRAILILTPITRELVKSGNVWVSQPRITAIGADGAVKTAPANGAGALYTGFRPASNAFASGGVLAFAQNASGTWSINTGNSTYFFLKDQEYTIDWIYFGNDPDNDIVTI